MPSPIDYLRALMQPQVRQPQPVQVPVDSSFPAQNRDPIPRYILDAMDKQVMEKRKPHDDFWNREDVRGLSLEEYMRLQQELERRSQIADRLRQTQSKVWM